LADNLREVRGAILWQGATSPFGPRYRGRTLAPASGARFQTQVSNNRKGSADRRFQVPAVKTMLGAITADAILKDLLVGLNRNVDGVRGNAPSCPSRTGGGNPIIFRGLRRVD